MMIPSIAPAHASLPAIARALETGQVCARDLIEQACAAASHPDSERQRIFIEDYLDQARGIADQIDQDRRSNRHASPFAGIPITVKDLFDIAGERTRAGSLILGQAQAATKTAPAIARLLKAGFINLGRTNMTEFAYSGVGLNPHFGTPASIWDRAIGRIPGGSSSGAAVAVAEGIVPLSIGTDTGGSCRVPAAFNAITGFKPTVGRITTSGVFPLAQTLDSIGPLANCAATARCADAIMAGFAAESVFLQQIQKRVLPIRGRYLAIVRNLVLEDLDKEVADDFDRAITNLSKAGFVLHEINIPGLERLVDVNHSGGIAAVQAFRLHRKWLDEQPSRYDPRIRARINAGSRILAADYLDMIAFQTELGQQFTRASQGCDAVLMPTVRMIAPEIRLVDDDAHYRDLNMACLRNSFIANFARLCAISIPMHRAGEAPTGLMMMADSGQDRHLLRLAESIEPLIG